MAQLSIKPFEDKDESNAIEIIEKISIGRDFANDIVIESDKASRHHCIIYVDQNDNVFVADSDSRNGTSVNDIKITKSEVFPNDVLQVGPKKFRFILTQGPDLKEAAPDREKDILRKTEIAGSEIIAAIPKQIELKTIISDESIKEKIESIVIKTDGHGPKKFRCPVNSIYTIGRLSFSDIFVDSKSVSRTHARIDVRENHVAIIDEGSTNGTYVNGEKITQKELQDGDTIAVGENKFAVSFEMKTDGGFTSFKKIEDFETIDLLKERDKVLEIIKGKYGESVLLEVERQTLLFYLEFEDHFKSCNTVNTKRNAIAKIVYLFSNPMGIFDGPTSELLIGKDGEKEEMDPRYLNQAQNILKSKTHSGIIYFEEPDIDMPMQIRMNGLALDFNEKLKILVFGIPYDNLSYLVYASNRLMLDQNIRKK